MSAATTFRIPDPAEPVPRVATPLALLVISLGLWISSTVLYLGGSVPWWATVLVNAVASYLAFTVSHDAAHHAASSNRRVNRAMGSLVTPLFAPHACFPTWRFIHMQHHRFTNHTDGADPDGWTMAGPAWQRPFRWITIDLWYLAFYVPRMGSRPRSERIEQAATLAGLTAVAVATVATGHFVDFLVVLIVPCRLAILYLAWAFDYLPHHGLHDKPEEDRLRTTRNRIGLERLLTPVLIYQNYHLVHHLHPVIPFYRYIAVWRRNEEGYLEGEPALSTPRGRELTVDEYRRLRELDQPR